MMRPDANSSKRRRCSPGQDRTLSLINKLNGIERAHKGSSDLERHAAQPAHPGAAQGLAGQGSTAGHPPECPTECSHLR